VHIILEYFEGQTLEEMIQEKGKIEGRFSSVPLNFFRVCHEIYHKATT